ncbi:protein kinase domain-containing protein [Rosistilla oblonga]|uniref:serine/threonine protein kinase n=1 Tax=Rosistilla oblonga TaxID=2527990 RepID=UPI003A974427
MSSLEPSLLSQIIDDWEHATDPPSLDRMLAQIADCSQRDRVDALLVDQKYRWARGDSIAAEEYLKLCPDIDSDPELRSELVLGEFRARGGATGLREEFVSRFPDLQADVDRQLSVASGIDSEADVFGTIVGSVANDSARDTSEFNPAPLSLDDFELQHCLGQGGMGSVFQAIQKSLNKPVAIKMLRTNNAPQRLVDRFLQEARVTASLQHPNIVSVHGVGRCPDGGYFLVMDLVDGQSLQDELSAGPLDVRSAAEIVRDAAAAVHHAHTRHLIHRDLKPSNIMRHRDGRVMVVDFGLAKLLADSEHQMTVDGAVLGTPSFMAPEQLESKRGAVSAVTDVFGLGGVLHALLTGRPACQGDSVMQTIAELMSERPIQPPSKLRAEIPSEIDAICLSCLQKEPSQRPATAAAVQQRLADWLKSSDASPGVSHRPTRSRWLAPAAAVAAIVLVGAALFLPSRMSPNSTASIDPTNAAANPALDVPPLLADRDVHLTWILQVAKEPDGVELAPFQSAIKKGDRVRIDVTLEEPRYVYAYWIGSDGTAQWIDSDGPPNHPVSRVSLPSTEGQVFPISGPSGMEICVLVTRSEPLDQPERLVNDFSIEAFPSLPEPRFALVDGRAYQPPATDTSQSENQDASLALLGGPSRVIGRAESLAAGSAGSVLAKWRSQWPRDVGYVHYLAIPHLAP